MKFLRILLIIALLTSISCTSSGGGDDSNGGDGGGGGEPVPAQGLQCGVVQNNSVTKDPSNGTLLDMTDVLEPNLLIMKDASNKEAGSLLVQLQGISVNLAKRSVAISKLESLTRDIVTFVEANGGCNVTVAGGGLGKSGHLITSDGKSINEELLRLDLVDVSGDSTCGTNLIAGCFNGIKGTNTQTAGAVQRMLWKPVSDSDGRLAVHSSPSGTTVIVNGEVGTNQGGGNGYSSLARFTRPGCAYGAGARIQIINSKTGLPYTFQGKTSFGVINPCDRNCIEGDQMAICPK